MPTTLSPEYFDAEKRYRTTRISAEKLACIEKMLAIIPKHKGNRPVAGGRYRRIANLNENPNRKIFPIIQPMKRSQI
jgi:hypothetical protein